MPDKEQGSKALFDPTKIKGPYPLLAAVVAVVESLLGFWFARADSGPERIIAGLIFLATVAGIFYVIIKLQMLAPANVVTPQGLGGKLTLADKDAAPSQQAALGPESISGPDGSYVIGKRPPPSDWTTRTTSLIEYGAQRQGLSVESYSEVFGAAAGDGETPANVLVFETKAVSLVVPIPGKTRIDGRPFPTGLETAIRTQVAVIPMDRMQTQFLFPKTFMHNLLTLLSGILASNVMTLTSLQEVSPANAAKRVVVELRQVLENVLVNGEPVDRIENHMTVIGFEGEVRDHVVLAQYASRAGVEDPSLARHNQAVQDLINSFQPLGDYDPAASRAKAETEAEATAAKFAHEFAPSALGRELTVILYRLNDAHPDLETSEGRELALSALRPMRQLAAAYEVKVPGLDEFWETIDAAEKGDATAFKEALPQLITRALELDKPVPEPEAAPEVTPEPVPETG